MYSLLDSVSLVKNCGVLQVCLYLLDATDVFAVLPSAPVLLTASQQSLRLPSRSD